MRKVLFLLAPVSLIALAACSAESDESSGNAERATVMAPEAATDAAAAPTQEAAGGGALSALPDIPVSLPQMAYAFDYGFRLAGEQIAPLQQQHADMCEAQGPDACRIVSMTRSGEDEDEIRGELQLAVASDKARGFGAMLTDAAEAADAEAFRANIQGEDVSKSLVDTEARLRSRIELRDRLMEVLRTRRGTVEELVEAERSVAAVNEEIDAARSWLAEQEGRVAYSRMTLSYESAEPGAGFLKPVEKAVGSLGPLFGTIVAVLILLGAFAVPVLAVVFGVRALRRRMRPSVVEA